MASQFFQDRFERPFPVTMLLLEVISGLAASAQEGENEATLNEVIRQALTQAELVKGSPTEEQVHYTLSRLLELQTQREEAAEGGVSKKRTFGSEYLKWLLTLNHEGLCFHTADYEVERARHLYCDVDYALVLELARQKADSEWQEKVIAFEACLFGFGGSYGDENTEVYDMTEDREAAEASIRSMGF